MTHHTNQFHRERRKQGLTIVKLAANANVSLPAIHAIERGKYGNLTTINKVAKALGKKVTITLE